MAIYHFSAKVIGRAGGSSAVASAAYRCSASRLHDERLGRDHDFTNKPGVIHSEVMLPDGAPERFGDRSTLWNEVEDGEVRKDAQLAREVEFAIPRELTQEQGVALAREFVSREFVDRGMVADLNVHWDMAPDGIAKPHAHVMLTMREVGGDGFGAKVRDWNSTAVLQQWRERWGDHVNGRLAELGLDARVDHRSFEAQGIKLEPQHKIGAAASRRSERGLETERIEDHARIARDNGTTIIASPEIALDAITRTQATFTTRDLAAFAFRHSDGKEQFDQVMSVVRASPELVALGRDGRGDERFTSRDMIAVEARLERAAGELAGRSQHIVSARDRDAALSAAMDRGLTLSPEQRTAFEHVTGKGGLASVVGYAGSGKSAMLGVAREAWEAAGYTVRGAALSGIAAENLEGGSGIASRTIASLEHAWGQDRDRLSSRDVLVIDEAGMIGSRQMERVLTAAHDAGAKVVMVGDAQQLQAIEAGAAFRALTERHGAVEITDIRRQREDWQRDATRQLATGRTGEALGAYQARGMVHVADTRETVRTELIDGWDRARQAEPGKSRIILTHTNAEVQALNSEARQRMRESGELGAEVTVGTERGERQFASGDRIMFLRNERSLEVKNGTLATVDQVTPERIAVRLDDGRQVAFDTRDYAHVDHGYAATIHKSQGVTVDQAHVLATPGMDRHSAYVSLSRHRDSVQLHYGRDEFTDLGSLTRTLSRDRSKEMAADYATSRASERDPNGARAFADRRDIRLPELARERDAVSPEITGTKARNIFAGFKPREAAPTLETRAPSHAPSQSKTIERFARATADIERMRVASLPALPHQQQALTRAGEALDQTRPQAARDLAAAFRREPALIGEAATGRTNATVRAMALEAEVRTNPELRADRFVAAWRQLGQQRDRLERGGDDAGADRLSKRMESLAGALHRDPQLESLLRNRNAELGIEMKRGRSVGEVLTHSLGIRRGRDYGMSL